MAIDPGTFVGGWSLVSLVQHGPAGEVHPFGEDAIGWILYTGNGRMGVHIARRQLPQALPAEASPDDLRALATGFVAYAGRWSVDDAQGAVVHHVDIAWNPTMVGTDQVRYCSFEGDRLYLRTPPVQVDGGEQHGVVTWQRVAA